MPVNQFVFFVFYPFKKVSPLRKEKIVSDYKVFFPNLYLDFPEN